MKINLGCGDRYVAGWVNTDLPSTPHRKDLAVDLTGPLPWLPGTLEAVYAGHVLEHLPFAMAHFLLERLLPLMKPGMPIMVVGPDVNVGRQLLPDGIADEFGATLDSLINGGRRWPGDEHHWECTPERLSAMLRDAGWSSVVTRPMDEVALLWPVADARPRWQCAVGALALTGGDR